MRVEIQPDKLSSYGIGLEDVRAAIASANADSAKGYIEQGDQRYEVMSNDQATKAADYQNLVIAYRNGAAVLLHDVAAVVDSNENIRNAGLYNNLPTVGVIVYPLPGANIIKTVAQIKKVLPSVVATLPPNIDVHIAMDRSQSVTAAVGDTERSLMIAVVLVIGVVFVFLQSPRATLIPAVVLPISILGTFGPMYLLGYSIDNLSLMSLTIATGFVVDDAVVVLENVVRHIESGMDVHEAALVGSGEVSFTVVSMSLSLIAVFIPILLFPGIIGLLFHEFAVTLSIAILISLLVSLTVTPTMCAYLLKRGESLHSKARWAVWTERQFERFKNVYSRSLTQVLDHALLVGIGLVVMILLILRADALGCPPRSSRSRTTDFSWARSSPTRASPFRRCRRSCNSFSRSCRPIPPWPRSSDSPARAPSTPPPSIVGLKPLAQRKLSADQVVAAAAAEAEPRIGRPAVLASGAGFAHRRPAIRRRIPVHLDERGHGGAVHVDPEAAR